MAGQMPDTRRLMKRAMYEFKGVARCKSCDAHIEWWRTTNDKMMPFDIAKDPLNEDERTVTHWATCPNARDHRGKPAAAPAAREAKTTSRQTELQLQQRAEFRKDAVHKLRNTSNARLIIALYDDGVYAAYRTGIPGEDLRHELITEANNIKRHLESQQ
jgi:hypothetical protein